MAGNGFKSPAPVLPAMGLHSFHNDSPPFAAASVKNQDPDSLHLDNDPNQSTAASSSSSFSSRPVHSRQSSHNAAAGAGAGAGGGANIVGLATLPVRPLHSRQNSNNNGGGGGVQHNKNAVQAPSPIPITQRGFSPLSALTEASSPQAVLHEDDQLSTSRSRRLLSGYMFGNPPTVDESIPSSPTRQAEALPAPAPPPSQTRDSSPLSTTQSSPTLPVENLAEQAAAVQIDNPPLPEMGTDDGIVNLQRGQSSKARDRETGYDRLNGWNDGEADLDESAPPAAFGTENYLLGAEGEAGQYRFPRHRLRTTMKDESKIPLIIVACGSFSPPTYLHLRMFEMAKDEILESQTYEIMAGYYSPVSSYYQKAGLAPAIHRVRMCELGVEHTSTWLMVDPWEAGQPEYQRTAVVLEHFNEMLNVQGGGLTMSDGKKRRYKIMLLAGGDLIESFGEPGVWSEPDLHIILGRFGCLIVERAGSDVWAFLLSHDVLYHHRRNVIVIKQLIYNDISSTKVRLFVKRQMSIKYLLPNSVIQYIYDNKLYR